MALIIGPKVRVKLAEKIPPVSETELRECFWNRTGKTLIVFIRKPGGDHILKSAYDPDEAEELIYEQESGF